MKVTPKRLTQLLPYFRTVAATQEAFWDAVAELEREFTDEEGCDDIDTAADLTTLTNRENVKAWLAENERSEQ